MLFISYWLGLYILTYHLCVGKTEDPRRFLCGGLHSLPLFTAAQNLQ